ncbi:hypothetical protein [Streptomyces sp. ME19-01-6]|uniref:hypothetical protein n=1 Tax=Streptomyces sp. ME19-01-6 TaxID=3028686 RepID=UPI0029AE2401|nr:hypothetical protein [Streptomyces sp. ME19-01-6]MDX3231854.1 hypothetical protein [Streptomyces sp. ME19-01-6]
MEQQLGLELRARLQPFQGRYEPAARDGDTAVLIRTCPGKHHRWGRICVLDEGHETAMGEPHWGHNSDGGPSRGWAAASAGQWCCRG